ncbi:MAG: toll/interleukin-1 receptor domain-containing protein [Burkholderiaceae bacterium]|nr:toll/interleukin-1 receptor domain-containing protein [Burkholderiaceae bacterium]
MPIACMAVCIGRCRRCKHLGTRRREGVWLSQRTVPRLRVPVDSKSAVTGIIAAHVPLDPIPTVVHNVAMIFLSHNHADKPLVEQVALRLASALGQANVFYDSWSIQPGEGIIDRMSDALGRCTHFFFFVSANSLRSRMVSLEWQNALLKATRGQCKLIPVRCDGSELPPIMAQSLYIDLFTVGLDAALAQISDVVQGANTYRAPAQPFGNLAFGVSGSATELVVEVRAKHFLEPIGSVLILIDNLADEFEAKPIDEDPFKGGFNADIQLNASLKTNAFLITVFRGITPAMPLRIQLKARDGHTLRFRGVLHQKSHDRWEGVPQELT